MSILKYLYPVPREDSKRILTFANHDDYISFRHHTYKKVISLSNYIRQNIFGSFYGRRFYLDINIDIF